MLKKKTDGRGFAISYIAEALSIPLKKFCYWLSDEQEENKSEYTLYRYATGQGVMRHWTFDEFFQEASEAVQRYCDNEDISSTEKDRIEALWEEEQEKIKRGCAIFFVDPDAPERSLEESEKIKLDGLNDIKSFFFMLDEQAAYKLQRHFSAYVNISADDFAFIMAILDMAEKERDSLKEDMLQMETIGAGEMLERLKSDEVQHWVNIRNADYRDICRKGHDVEKSWSSFKEEYVKIGVLQALMLLNLLVVMFITPPVDGQYDLDTRRFGTAEIDLLLLFKYCLAETAQAKVLQKLN